MQYNCKTCDRNNFCRCHNFCSRTAKIATKSAILLPGDLRPLRREISALSVSMLSACGQHAVSMLRLGWVRGTVLATRFGRPNLHHLHDLGDIRVGLELDRADVHLLEVLQELIRDRLHLLRPRCAPHQRLAVRPDLADDLSDLRLEALKAAVLR